MKVSEAPTTKAKLKKAILDRSIIVFKKNTNCDNEYKKLETILPIILLWDGFNYSPKYQGAGNDVEAYLGTSYYYKFCIA